MTSCADVAALAENSLAYPAGRAYAVIVGANPSSGARSPALWNAAFRQHDIDAEMVPVDVSAEHLAALLETLEADPCFLGGAVAAPYKEVTAQWLGARMTTQAAQIGAVNSLFRDGTGRLMGTNTDGEGALVSFVRRFGAVAGRSVLLMGPGGAGKAVAAFFRRAVEPGGRLFVAGRSEGARHYAERLGCGWVEWCELAAVLPEVEVLVNCTSIGSSATAGDSPVAADVLATLPDRAVIFDIIYDPSPSTLLTLAAERGLRVLDGSSMNLEQAVLAYGYAAAQPKGQDTTRAAMEQTRR